MYYTDERTHANRTPTPARDALHSMLLNNRPTHKTLARDLINWLDEDTLKDFIIQHQLEEYVLEDEILV